MIDLLSVLVYRDLVFLSRVYRRLTKGIKYLWMEDPAGGVTREGTPLFLGNLTETGLLSSRFGRTLRQSTLEMGARGFSRKSPSSTRRETTPPHSCLATIAS